MGIMVPVQKVQTDNQDTNQIQINIINALQPLGNQINKNTAAIAANPVQGGVLLNGIVLSTSPLKITQTLGKIPAGWILTDQSANQTVHRTAWDVNSITLVATGACTVNVLVF